MGFRSGRYNEQKLAEILGVSVDTIKDALIQSLMGTYAKVWAIEPKSDTNTSVRLSISRKNKQTGEYEQDFSGFVSFIGTSAAKKAACLKEGDRIKLGEVDVTTSYNSEKKISYTNFKCFSFDVESSATTTESRNEPQPNVDNGEVDDSRLPF